MAQFNKAIPIVMVALMLTGLCGYLLQTDHEIVETSRYDYKGNLNPSVQYSKIDDWTEYNPLNNITGWNVPEGSGTIPLLPSGMANQYVLSPQVVGYTEHTSVAKPYMYFDGTQTDRSGYVLNSFLNITNSDYGLSTLGQYSDWPKNDIQGQSAVFNTVSGNLAYDFPADGVIPTDKLFYGAVGKSAGKTSIGPGATRVVIPFTMPFTITEGGSTSTYVNSYAVNPSTNAVVPLSWFTYEGISNFTVIHTERNMYVLTEEKIENEYTYVSGVARQYLRINVSLESTEYKDWIMDNNLLYPAKMVGETWEKVSGSSGTPIERLVYLYKLNYYKFPDGTDPDHVGEIYDIPTPTYDVPQLTPAQYVDPNEFIQVTPTKYVTWNNKETNGIIRVLTTNNNRFVFNDGRFSVTCPTNLPYEYYLATMDFVNKSFKCQGVTFLENTQAYTVADYEYSMARYGTVPDSVTSMRVYNATVNEIITYPAYSISVQADHKGVDVTWYGDEETSGGSSESGNYVEHHWYWSDFWPTGKPLSVDFNPDYTEVTLVHGDFTTTVPVDAYGQAYVNYEVLPPVYSKVYVDSTVIAVDPLGVLWGNPELYLSYYFPDQMAESTRVLFNGFVKEGYSMTINGQSFDIVDGAIYHYDEIKKTTLKLPIKGMAVDYVHHGTAVNVSLIFTEYSNYKLDLGPLDDTMITVPGTDKEIENGYVISANGTWYWQSALYDIQITTEDKLGFDITSGIFALSWSAACLLMIGFIIVCTAVMYYIMRDEMEIAEWLTVIISIVILLVLGAIF